MGRIWDNIHQYKKELMGLAILMIMLFHSGVSSYMYSAGSLLELGVDLFLFMGGVTCCKSLCSHTGKGALWIYCKKRVWRIVPPFLILYTLIYGYEYLIAERDVLQFVANITMWINVAHNGLRNWFVPAVLMMYLILPFYERFCRNHPVCFWLLPFWGILFIAILAATNNLRCVPFFMFWTRLPVFLLGIGLYSLKNNVKIRVGDKFVLTAALLSFCLSWYCSFQSFIALRRLLYIPIVIAIVYFYDYFRFKVFKKLFAFLGGFTLEIYLLHEYTVSVFHAVIPSWHPTALGMVVGVGLAYVYHRTLDKFVYS